MAGSSPSSAAWWMSSPRGFRGSTSLASGRLRKLREKNPLKKCVKNDIQKKTTKNWRALAFEPNFGLFVWQIVKEAFKSSDSSLFVPVVCCFDVIFGVQNVPLGPGCGEDVCIRLGVKDCTRKQKTDPKQRTLRSEISTKFVCRSGICLLQKCQMLPPQQSTRLFNISTPRNSRTFSNWLEPNCHRPSP